MVEEIISNLLKVLKDIDEEELVNKVNRIRENNQTQVTHLFLEEYFRNKDTSIPSNTYKYEAQCIVNIFPQYAVEYITSMLETLGSEDNRVVVILRQLLKNEPIKTLHTSHKYGDFENEILPDSARNSESISTSPQPSTSQVVNPVHTINLKNETLTSKQDTSKRKIHDPQVGSLKIKLQRKGLLYSIQEKQEHYMPSTSTSIPASSNTVKPCDLRFPPEVCTSNTMANNSSLSTTLPKSLPVNMVCSKNLNTIGGNLLPEPISNQLQLPTYQRLDDPKGNNNAVSSLPLNLSVDNKLYLKIIEIFPDAAPTYLKQLCANKQATTNDIDAIVQLILSNENYPKRGQKEPSPDPELDLEEQVTRLKNILPDADPNYLLYHAELYLNDKDRLKEFISNALEVRNYPTIKDYLRKQQISAQVKQYTSEFNVEKFLEIIPNPDAHFRDPSKICLIHIDIFCLHYLRMFLRNRYLNIDAKTINVVMAKQKGDLTAITNELDSYLKSGKYLMKRKRKPISFDGNIENIPLLQEIAYITHRTEIKDYLKEKEIKEKQEQEIAKQNGLLHTCSCCFDEEVMPKNIVRCSNGCDFCKNCVKTSVEVLFGEGKLEYPCLQDCSGSFSLQTLKEVLTPKLFSKMARKKQVEEVKAAGIEDLEMCPFCDFATIPAPEDKLFKCLNPDCMKESCRQCKEPSHVPLRCDEVEKDAEVKTRTYIEDKMTEALLRVCYKCGLKFIKADGCNKMTCDCGAIMCYVCGQPVKDYKHFNGQGGKNYHLCPLYSDTNKLHRDAVMKGAEQAKVEIGVANDPKKLKIDPAADLDQYL